MPPTPRAGRCDPDARRARSERAGRPGTDRTAGLICKHGAGVSRMAKLPGRWPIAAASARRHRLDPPPPAGGPVCALPRRGSAAARSLIGLHRRRAHPIGAPTARDTRPSATGIAGCGVRVRNKHTRGGRGPACSRRRPRRRAVCCHCAIAVGVTECVPRQRPPRPSVLDVLEAGRAAKSSSDLCTGASPARGVKAE